MTDKDKVFFLQRALEFMLDRFECREGNLFSQRLACTKAREILDASSEGQEGDV